MEAFLNPLLEYGILGIFLGILIFFTRSLLNREKERSKREEERADRLDAEVTRLNAVMIDRLITGLNSATNAIQSSTQIQEISHSYLQQIQREREIQEAVRSRLEASDRETREDLRRKSQDRSESSE